MLFLKKGKPLDNSAGASQPGKEPAADDDSTAFASQEETRQAILSVLKLRQHLRWCKGIAEMGHVLTGDERGELTNAARAAYEEYGVQVVLQETDVVKRQSKGAEQ